MCLFACGGSSSLPVSPSPGGYLLTGTIVDSETGAPISRRDIFVHAFNDSIDLEISLEPADESTFTVRLPLPEVRLRIADKSDQYHLFESRIDIPVAGLNHQVQLVPTHFVRLHGQLLTIENGVWKSKAPGAGHFGISFALDGDRPGIWPCTLSSSASFEVHLPRDRLRIFLIDTELSPNPSCIDLTGIGTDLVELEIRLETR